MAWVDTQTAIERMYGILSEAHSFGIIEGYEQCPGVPSFDVETLVICNNCEGNSTSWKLVTIDVSGIPANGLGAFADATPALALACNECSETLRIVTDDEEVNRLVRDS